MKCTTFILFWVLSWNQFLLSLMGSTVCLSVCLSTDITSFNLSGSTGQNLTTSCQYPKGTLKHKFLCKGEDPSLCVPLSSPNDANSKFSSKDFSKNHNINVTMRNLTTADTGTYWCGTKGITPKESNRFFCRIFLFVGEYRHPAGLASRWDHRQNLFFRYHKWHSRSKCTICDFASPKISEPDYTDLYLKSEVCH